MAKEFKKIDHEIVNRTLAETSREDLISGQADYTGQLEQTPWAGKGYKKRDKIIPIPLEDSTERQVAAQRRRARQTRTGYQSTVLTETLG